MIAHIRPPKQRRPITPLTRARQMVAETFLPKEEVTGTLGARLRMAGRRRRLVRRTALLVGGFILLAAAAAAVYFLVR